jgi:hypothetical protein
MAKKGTKTQALGWIPSSFEDADLKKPRGKDFYHSLWRSSSPVMLAVRLMFTVQLGTPRGRYDEYSSKVFPQ